MTHTPEEFKQLRKIQKMLKTIKNNHPVNLQDLKSIFWEVEEPEVFELW